MNLAFIHPNTNWTTFQPVLFSWCATVPSLLVGSRVGKVDVLQATSSEMRCGLGCMRGALHAENPQANHNP